MRKILSFFVMVCCFLFVNLACADDFVTNNSNGNFLQRWTDGKMVWSTTENVSGVALLDIGPDGNVYGSTSLGDNVRVWNGGTGAYLGTVIVEGNIAPGYEISRVYGIKFGPDVDGDGIEDLYSF